MRFGAARMTTSVSKPILNRRRIAYLIATAIYFFIGYLGANEQAKISSGYAASYWFLGNLVIGIYLIGFLSLIGFILLILKPLRWFAPVLFLSIVLLPLGFLVSLKTLSFLGKVRYEKEDRMIELGSDMPKGLVILFKKQTSLEQREQFRSEILYKPPSERGHSLVDGVCMLAGALKVQDYDAVEVRFCADSNDSQRAQLKAKVKASLIVFKVFEDIRPNEIKSVK